MALKPTRRDYGCSDATLKQKSDQVADCVTRDIASFNGFGVTTATVTTFKSLITAFDAKITDDEMIGDQTTATAAKNDARKHLENTLRIIRGMAQDFYKGQGLYRKFGFDNFTDATDNEFSRICKRIHRLLTDPDDPIGSDMTDAYSSLPDQINELGSFSATFDTALDTIVDKRNDRDIATQDRIIAGNALYKELIRLADLGKTIFQDTDEARYNDYVLNLQPTPAEPPAPVEPPVPTP